MIIVPLKEGENIEKALKKFKRKSEKTSGIYKTFCLEKRSEETRYLRTKNAPKSGVILLTI